MCNKIELYHLLCTNYPIYNSSDPICHLINSIEEVEEIYEKYPYESKKLFYFMKNDIHKLFFEKDFIFPFNSKDLERALPKNSNKIKLSELFYLELLIRDEPEIINYSFDIDYIILINNKLFKKKIKNSVQCAIIARIILLLIDNYLNANEENLENIKELESIKKANLELIKNSLESNETLIMLNYTLDDFLDKKIEEIYLDIILYLIKNKKFSNDNDTYEIIEDLDLENISLTQTMYEGLFQILDENNDYLKYYRIENYPDFNEIKINFYYILIKLILKNFIYLSNIPFLWKNFLKIINLRDFFIFIRENPNYHKIIYFFGIYPGYNIYVSLIDRTIEFTMPENIIEDITPNNANIYNKTQGLDYGLFEENKITTIAKENSQTQNIHDSEILDIKNKIDQIYDRCAQEILNNVTIILTPNKENNNDFTYRIKEVRARKNKLQIEFFKDLLNNLDKENKITYLTYKNFELLLQFIEDIKEYIAQNELNYKPDIKLEFTKEFNYDEDKFFDEKYKYVYNITCISSFEVNEKDGKQKEYKFIDYDVLLNGIDGESNGFQYLINELCNDDYKSEEFDN